MKLRRTRSRIDQAHLVIERHNLVKKKEKHFTSLTGHETFVSTSTRESTESRRRKFSKNSRSEARSQWIVIAKKRGEPQRSSNIYAPIIVPASPDMVIDTPCGTRARGFAVSPLTGEQYLVREPVVPWKTRNRFFSLLNLCFCLRFYGHLERNTEKRADLAK